MGGDARYTIHALDVLLSAGTCPYVSPYVAGDHMRAGRRRSEQIPSSARHRVAHVCVCVCVYVRMRAREAHVRVPICAFSGLAGGALPRCFGILFLVRSTIYYIEYIDSHGLVPFQISRTVWRE